jgi:hypothetical protein
MSDAEIYHEFRAVYDQNIVSGVECSKMGEQIFNLKRDKKRILLLEVMQ